MCPILAQLRIKVKKAEIFSLCKVKIAQSTFSKNIFLHEKNDLFVYQLTHTRGLGCMCMVAP